MNAEQVEAMIIDNVESYCLSMPRIKKLIDREVISRFDVEKVVKTQVRLVRSGKALCSMRMSDVIEKTSKAVKDQFKCHKL